MRYSGVQNSKRDKTGPCFHEPVAIKRDRLDSNVLTKRLINYNCLSSMKKYEYNCIE